VFTLEARARALWVYGIDHFHVPGKLRERKESVLGTRWTVRTGATASYPPLQILAAVVRRFADAGRRPLVWIGPVNVDHLMSLGVDVSGFEKSVAAIRTVVEGNGGKLLDLHATLREEQFLDAGDHATSTGEHPGSKIVADHIVAGLLSSENR
jgi:poly-D-alanine transfer protein DltD